MLKPIKSSQIPVLIRTWVASEQPGALLLIGRPGIGKTMGVVQTCQELGFETLHVRCNTLTEIDTIGYPHVGPDGVRFYPSARWPSHLPSDRRVALILDELNTVESRCVWQQLLSLLDDGRLHCYNFNTPSGRPLVVAMMNYATQASTSSLPANVRSRCCIVHVEPDTGAIKEYLQAYFDGRDRFVAPAPVRLARNSAHEQAVLTHVLQHWGDISERLAEAAVAPELEAEDVPVPAERSLTSIIKALAMLGQGVEPSVVEALVAGRVGGDMASRLTVEVSALLSGDTASEAWRQVLDKMSAKGLTPLCLEVAANEGVSLRKRGEVKEQARCYAALIAIAREAEAQGIAHICRLIADTITADCREGVAAALIASDDVVQELPRWAQM